MKKEKAPYKKTRKGIRADGKKSVTKFLGKDGVCSSDLSHGGILSCLLIGEKSQEGKQ